MNYYTAHLRRDDSPGTACGEPWQGWQEPFDMDLCDPYAAALPPMQPPRARNDPGGPDRIRRCQACLRVVLHPREGESAT